MRRSAVRIRYAPPQEKPLILLESWVLFFIGNCKKKSRCDKIEDENITAAWVPGAFEIPITAQKMAQSGKYDAIICVGAVIRGDTSHYDLVCNESAKGIAQVELATGIPVLFGVITTENIEQAISRAGSKGGNKGYDCALSAIEMVNLLRQM